MTAIPNLNKPAIPFTPTADAQGTPTVCRCCARRAIGTGVGLTKPKDDPSYLCGECVLIIEDLAKMRRLDQFELQALDGGVDAVGEWLGERGITDLALLDELDARMLVKAAWLGCADRLRAVLREAPF